MRRNVLNITASDVKDAKLTATVTIPAADVDAAIKKAYKDTAKKYRFPGFRAGKAPRPVIDSALGAEATLAQATNDLIAANEPAVLNELDIVPTKNGDYKELDLAKDHEDYTYTVEFSLRPAAELSSFDAVEIEMPPAEVTESEINNQVETSTTVPPSRTSRVAPSRPRTTSPSTSRLSRTPTTLPLRAACSSPVATATPRSSTRP